MKVRSFILITKGEFIAFLVDSEELVSVTLNFMVEISSYLFKIQKKVACDIICL